MRKHDYYTYDNSDELIEAPCSIQRFQTPTRRIMFPRRPQSERKPPKKIDKMTELRNQSLQRLKSAFESIFDRYGKDFEGKSDEVDIRTGEILVDKGMLRRTKPKAFGDVYKMKNAPLIDIDKARQLLHEDKDLHYDENEEAEEVDESYDPAFELMDVDIDELLSASFDFSPRVSPDRRIRKVGSSPIRPYSYGHPSSREHDNLAHRNSLRFSDLLDTPSSKVRSRAYEQSPYQQHSLSAPLSNVSYHDHDDLISSPADFAVGSRSQFTPRKRMVSPLEHETVKRQRRNQMDVDEDGLDLSWNSQSQIRPIHQTPSRKHLGRQQLSSPDRHKLLSPSKKFLENQAKIRPSKPSPLSKMPVISRVIEAKEDKNDNIDELGNGNYHRSPLAQKHHCLQSQSQCLSVQESGDSMNEVSTDQFNFNDPTPASDDGSLSPNCVENVISHQTESSSSSPTSNSSSQVSDEMYTEQMESMQVAAHIDKKDVSAEEMSNALQDITLSSNQSTENRTQEFESSAVEVENPVDLKMTSGIESNDTKTQSTESQVSVSSDISTVEHKNANESSLPWWASYDLALDDQIHQSL